MRTKSAVPLFSSKSWLLSTSFTNFNSQDKYLWRRYISLTFHRGLRQSYVCGGVLNHQWFLNFPVAETARCGKISRSKGFSLRVCIDFASFFNFVLWSWSKSIEANKHPLTLSVNRTINCGQDFSVKYCQDSLEAQYKLIEDSCLIWLHRYKKLFQLRISDTSQRQSNYLSNLIYNPDISLIKNNS